MDFNLEPNKFYVEYCYSISEDDLRVFSKKNPSEGLIRFFSRLNDIVFGSLVSEDENSIQLFYAENRREFKAIGIPIPINYELSNELVLVLSREIIRINPNLDIFNVFNTLQHQRETTLEALGYFTLDPKDIKNGTLITVGQTVIPVWKLDRVDFMKKMFVDIVDNESLDPKNKIYLMVDDVSGYVKIGKSIDPKFREGTLQSKKPETHLIAHWTAPAQIEKDLHSKFVHKRRRGEWFHLTIEELDEIKLFMNSLT